MILGGVSGLFAGVTVVDDVPDLMHAVNNGSAGDTVILEAGTYELTGPLQPKDGMTIQGAGRDETVITAALSWEPNLADFKDGGTNHNQIDRNGYLFDLGDGTTEVTLSDMKLTGPQLYGALYGNNCDGLEMYNLYLKDFLWSGIRTFRMDNGRIHDNVFENAGGRFNHSGGALFLTWVKYSEFWNNWIFKTGGENHYGFKGRQAKHCRFHHNTVEVNFSLEFPFENDEYNEIDHNYFAGEMSIPKYGGGAVVENGHTFHIHHNWSQKSSAIEGARNSIIVHHNLFDLDTSDDKGNLVYCHKSALAPGPCDFYNNLIKNPGRGVFWTQSGYNHINWHNNHVIANTTITPRTDGLFGLNEETTDFGTITIRDNIIECDGTERPLMRNDASYGATIENNTLIGISDTDRYANPDTGMVRGLTEPLYFTCGAYEEFLVDGWNGGYNTTCGWMDVNDDSVIGLAELENLFVNWIASECSFLNSWCGNADNNRSGGIDVNDIGVLAAKWLSHCD